jgi:hypothetical protein
MNEKNIYLYILVDPLNEHSHASINTFYQAKKNRYREKRKTHLNERTNSFIYWLKGEKKKRERSLHNDTTRIKYYFFSLISNELAPLDTRLFVGHPT